MIGVVGDDTTGSLDVGVMFRRAGCRVRMCLGTASGVGFGSVADVVVVDTDSRLDTPATAAARVHAATRSLQAAGCTRFYKKTCSVFRGNAGAEFDAMLEATGARQAVVAPAYPLLGRTTRNGRHFVHGRPLEQSAFAHDPIHPRTTSDLRRILAEQSTRSAAVIPLEIVRAGATLLRDHLHELSREHAYLIVDGETDDDLATLALAGRDFHVFGGSAGFASFWPATIGLPRMAWPIEEIESDATTGVLVVCGSLTPESRRQSAVLRATGLPVFEFDPLHEPDSARWAAEQARKVAAELRAGIAAVLVTTVQEPSRVAEIQASAAREGLDVASAGRRISRRLADLCAGVLEIHPRLALVVAGGDTSGAIARRLEISACDVGAEFAPGVPLCRAHRAGGGTLPVLFKSGSFGSDTFLADAVHRFTRPRSATH